jgi:predicted aldo/keto reductase-like oxidoreductase
MIYRPYGKTGKEVSALGFGSIRFHAEDLADEDGLWRCAALVRRASALGVNYFDVAPSYAKGLAERIFGLAFQDMPNPFFVSDKSIITADRTADEVRRRIDQSLMLMGVERITFYHMWSIMNRDHYYRVMARGGPYDGAVQAKKEGLIEHICFSTHANVRENLEIIQGGGFEGMLLSFNVLNQNAMRPVLQAAAAGGMGIAAMNPLCGGLIVKQPRHLQYLMQPGDENIAAAALRFVASFPGLSVVLSGMATENEVIENAAALSSDPAHGDRLDRVLAQARELSGQFCTGCGYCGCPENIPVADYMQAYNMRLFPGLEYMGRVLPFEDKGRIKADNIFRTLRQTSGLMPESTENPCVKCGKCEEKCTQGLPIMAWLDDMAGLVARHEYSQAHLEGRIAEALARAPGKRLGLYPAGVYTEAFQAFMKRHFPDQPVQVFDKNPALWGKPFADSTIKPPQDIPAQVNVLLITHFLYQDEIYRELCHLEGQGVQVIKLHRDGDIPYFG